MKCSEAQQQLSAYHDGELTSETSEVVAAHVADCRRCASRLAEFERYSRAFRQLPQPQASASTWEGITAQLEQELGETTWVVPVAADQNIRSWLTTRRLALAASVLLMLSFGFWMSQHESHSDPHHAEFAMTMDHYLKQLATDPDGAERFLLSKYSGRTVDAEDAVKLVGYRPAVASGLPREYTLASTSVMTMPCCTCVKAVCKRQDGSTLVLFEHDDAQTEWFGMRRSKMATCGDQECCLVDLDSSIAATWKRGSRWITAVGVRDTDEVSQLVTWADNKIDSQTKPREAGADA